MLRMTTVMLQCWAWLNSLSLQLQRKALCSAFPRAGSDSRAAADVSRLRKKTLLELDALGRTLHIRRICSDVKQRADDSNNACSATSCSRNILLMRSPGFASVFSAASRTLAEWKAKRSQLRTEFLDMIGLWPLPEKTPLNATTTGTIERGLRRRKAALPEPAGTVRNSEPLAPAAIVEKLPAVLLFVGHYNRGRNGHKTFMQDQGKWFARNGYVCLIMDTLTRGELPGDTRDAIYNGERMWWISRGYSPAAVECWNAIRGIDYLDSRPEVDADRIAATGLSGGGAVTFWIAAVDDRVKCAAAALGADRLGNPRPRSDLCACTATA